MQADELAAIRERQAACDDEDRGALLAEVERLRVALDQIVAVAANGSIAYESAVIEMCDIAEKALGQ